MLPTPPNMAAGTRHCYAWFASGRTSTSETMSGDSASLLAAWILQDEFCTCHLPRLSAITLTEADAVYVRWPLLWRPLIVRDLIE